MSPSSGENKELMTATLFVQKWASLISFTLLSAVALALVYQTIFLPRVSVLWFIFRYEVIGSLQNCDLTKDRPALS